MLQNLQQGDAPLNSADFEISASTGELKLKSVAAAVSAAVATHNSDSAASSGVDAKTSGEHSRNFSSPVSDMSPELRLELQRLFPGSLFETIRLKKESGVSLGFSVVSRHSGIWIQGVQPGSTADR